MFDVTNIAWSIIEGFFGSFKEKVVDVVVVWVDVMFAMIATPFTFDWLGTFITFFQGVAIALVFLIVMVKGITSGILLNGGSEEESIGHYLFKSFIPIALIAATPTIVGVITTITTEFVQLVAGTGNRGFAESLVNILTGRLTEGAAVGNIAVDNPIVTALVLIVTLYYIFVISAQCIKRWVQLAILSLLVPITCIFTAAEDSSDYVTVLKSMAYAGVITALQVLLLKSAPAMPALGMAIGGGGVTGAIGACLLTIGLLSAIKKVPDWIEKYTAASSVAGAGGLGRHVSTGVRTATSIASVVKK